MLDSYKEQFGEEAPFTGHDGTLSKDSPALYKTFTKLYPAKLVQTLEEAYRAGSTRIEFKDGRVERDEGVSFNPKSARIAKIILTESECRKVEAFLLAFLREIPHEEQSETFKQFGIEGFSGYDSKRKDLRNERDATISDLVHFAAVLDDARHLHMTNASKAEYREFRESVSLLIKSPVRGVERLKTLLSHWLQVSQRQKRWR